MVAPFKAVDCYVLVTSASQSGVEGLLLKAAFLHQSLVSVRYTYERRFGCRAATISVHRDKAHPEFLALERLDNIGQVAVFARDPQSLAQAQHPLEPGVAFDTTAYLRIWSGRVATLRADYHLGKMEIEAEGFATQLEETVPVGTTLFVGQTIAQIATAIVQGFTVDIETTGRMATIVDEFDATGRSVAESIESLTDIAGPTVDWGVNRNRVFFMKARSNPFHQSGGYLDSVGAETEIEEVEIERDLRGLRTQLQVTGAKDSVSGFRITALFESALGIARFGARREDLVRDDVRSPYLLAQVGNALLRERLIAPTRLRVKVQGDVRYRLDEKSLRPIVLRTGRSTPVSYASGQLTAPGAAASGFAVRLTRSGGGFIIAFHPDNLHAGPLAYYAEVVRKGITSPSVGQRFTIIASPANVSPTNPAFRLVVTNPAGTVNVILEAWNGTAVVTVTTYVPPASLVGVIAAWGVQMRPGSGAIFRDGVQVAFATAASVGVETTNISGIGANEDLLDFDDAEVTDFGFWGILDRVGTPTHPIWVQLGAHTTAIQRWMTELGKPLFCWLPFWEGQGTTIETIGNYSGNPQARTLSTLNGAATWVPGLVQRAGGGRVGPPVVQDARWGNGDLYGGSPIASPDSLEREWGADSGWTSEIEGGLGGSSLSRPLADLEARIAALETGRRLDTGTTTPGGLT